jgi:hypothetical protein
MERDLAAPPGLHVEPLGVPEMGLQPGHAPLPPVVLRQQVAGSSSKTQQMLELKPKPVLRIQDIYPCFEQFSIPDPGSG